MTRLRRMRLPKGLPKIYRVRVRYLDNKGLPKNWRSAYFTTEKGAVKASYKKFHAGHPQVTQRELVSISFKFQHERFV